MLDKARPYSRPILERLAGPFLGLHPNTITLIGFLFGITFFVAFYFREYGFALILYLGVLVDSMDGTVARMTGKESKWGAFFDSTLDRFTDSLLLAAFGVAGLVTWPLVTATIVMSLMISYTRGTAEKLTGNRVKLAVGIIERPERLIFIFVATVVAWYDSRLEIMNYRVIDLLFVLLTILSLVTVVERMAAAKKILK